MENWIRRYFVLVKIFSKSNNNIYSALRISKSVVTWFRAQFWCCTQFKIEDLMAVWWKNHIIWNTTIPQDQKFSTVIVISTKLPGPYSSKSLRSRHLLIWQMIRQRILQQKILSNSTLYSRRWHMDFGADISIFSTSSGELNIIANRTHIMSSGSVPVFNKWLIPLHN